MHHPGTNNKVYKKINDNFEWSSENFKKISEIIKKYPSNRIPVSYTHLRAHET